MLQPVHAHFLIDCFCSLNKHFIIYIYWSTSSSTHEWCNQCFDINKHNYLLHINIYLQPPWLSLHHNVCNTLREECWSKKPLFFYLLENVRFNCLLNVKENMPVNSGYFAAVLHKLCPNTNHAWSEWEHLVMAIFDNGAPCGYSDVRFANHQMLHTLSIHWIIIYRTPIIYVSMAQHTKCIWRKYMCLL